MVWVCQFALVRASEAQGSHPKSISRFVPQVDVSAALDLAEQLLDYDPAQRVTASQAMEAPYFLTEEPKAEKPTSLATLEGEWHELEAKRERAKKKKR